MAIPPVKIKVGASADASLTTIFRSLADLAQKARKQVEGEMKTAGKAIGTSMKDGTSVAEREYQKLVAEVTGEGASMMKPAGKAIQEFADGASQHLRVVRTNFDAMAKSADQALTRMAKAKPSTLMQTLGKDIKFSGVTNAAIGYGRAALGFGSRLAGDVVRGAGIDIDPTSQMAKHASLQSTLIDITNSGYMPGAKGANGQRQDTSKLGGELAKTANETGFAVNDAAEGLQAFVAKTGDLETGRAVFKDLAVLSRATGTHLADMVDAAGDVSTALGDVPNKGEKIAQVMRAIAGQGKLGAVEIRDLAAQMAKVAANAGQISGDAGTNIAILGALTQESRAKGGSASATQAATSASSFMNTFSKGARLDAFKTFGVNVHDDNGLIRNPMEIIKDAIRAASTKNGGMKNFNENMGDMFKDVRARSVTKGFETTFLQAGGGEAGISAVSAEMDKLTQSMMGQGEIMTSFGDAMGKTEAQANIVNNKFQDTAGKLQDAMLPAVVAMTPALLMFAKLVSEGAISLAAFLKKMGIGDDNAEGAASSASTASIAKDLREKTKNGTVVQADVDAANQQRAEIDKAIAKKQEELKQAKDSAKTNSDGTPAFSETGVGKLLAWADPTGTIKNQFDRSNGAVGQKEQELSSLENQHINLDQRIGKAEDVVRVHIVADSTAKPLAKPAAAPHPVNAQH